MIIRRHCRVRQTTTFFKNTGVISAGIPDIAMENLMCLTSGALFLFISLLSPDLVDITSEKVTIDAEAGPVSWDLFDDQWCTVAPLSAQSSSKG